MAAPRISLLELVRQEDGLEFEWLDAKVRPRWYRIPDPGLIPSELVVSAFEARERAAQVETDEQADTLLADFHRRIVGMLTLADPEQVKHLPEKLPVRIMSMVFTLASGGSLEQTPEDVIIDLVDTAGDVQPVSGGSGVEGADPPTQPVPPAKARRGSGSRSRKRSPSASSA